MDKDFPLIIDDIKNGDCILVIGPDLHDFGDKSFFELMSADLLSDNTYKQSLDLLQKKSGKQLSDHPTDYIFLNEELLQSRDERAIANIGRIMKTFYDQQSVFDEPFQKIAHMNFPLIISLMPDDRLQKTFSKYGFEHNFAYYPKNGSNVGNVVEPTIEKPLIYNLLGNFATAEHIITFDHMFTFLYSIMRGGLPKPISICMSKAKSFIFLGVHFERWHSQLLLKIMTMNDKHKKVNKSNSLSSMAHYTISKDYKNDEQNDIRLFVGRRLQLKLYTDNPELFLDRIYTTLQVNGDLKRPPAPPVKVFISYTTSDQLKVRLINNVLRQNNITVIVDEDSLKGGEHIDKYILTKIQEADVVTPIVTERSLCSRYVIKEISTAIAEGKFLLPICIEEDLFKNPNLFQSCNNTAMDNIRSLAKKSLDEVGSNTTRNYSIEQQEWEDYRDTFPKVLEVLTKINSRMVSIEKLPDSMSFYLLEIKALADEKRG